MYAWLLRFVSPSIALALTAVTYGMLLLLLFSTWTHEGAEYRYLQL